MRRLPAELVILFLLLAGGCRLAGPALPHPADFRSSDRIVVTHYFNWFKTPDVGGSWRGWEWKGNGPQHNPDLVLTNGRRDIASVYYPLIGPYDSAQPDVVEYHMLTALAAKIDGFFIDWYGISSEEEKGFGTLLDAAARIGFKMCVCFEDKAMFGYGYNVRTRDEAVRNAISNLNYVLETHGAHPAYLRIDGVPVVINFSWSEPADSVKPKADGFSAAEYSRILSEVRKKNPVYFIHDYHAHIRESYWDVSDNVYPWLDVNGDALERFYGEARQRYRARKIRFVTSLVYPGFDNTGVWGWGDGPFITPRDNGAFYSRSWERALSNNVRFVQIATWNDFGEGATIEPTLDYGYQYLERTEKYAARLKHLPSNGGAGLGIPLMIYRERQALTNMPFSDPGETAARTSRLDRTIQRFLEGRFREAQEIANTGRTPEKGP
jgi:glycoprotein endo-alpha-1,2-mannosidase